MASAPQPNGTGGRGLADYLAILWRRKWIALAAVIIVPAAAVAFSLRQTPLYEASAEVLLSRQNLAGSLTGTEDPTLSLPAERLPQTQADLARVPGVAQRALDEAGVTDLSTNQFLRSSSVSTATNSDILTFTVESENPERAEVLASAYAQAFTEYRLELDTAALANARDELEARIDELEAQGEASSALYASLVDKEQQLETLAALQTSNAFVVRTADDAGQTRPQPIRNGLLGLGLGLVLSLALVFIWEALDTRVRRVPDLERELGLTLLGRLPAPPRRLRRHNQFAMLAEPTGIDAEAFRMLRQNVEFASLSRDVRTIMVTSALPFEGKTTTAVNLAVALARGGERAVLVDLDLRKPAIASIFRLEDRAGLTDVALGRLELEDALVPIALPAGKSSTAGPEANGGNGQARLSGVLEVLASGPTPPDVGEFVASDTLALILEALAKHGEHIVIDAPPLLGLGDALALGSRVDALLVVARLTKLHRGTLTELRRVLDQVPAAKLGLVATDIDAPVDAPLTYYTGSTGRTRSRQSAR